MGLKVLDITFDKVIDSHVLFIKVDYGFALKHLYPRVNQLDFQRNKLKTKLYETLKRDIIDGCIMPPITIAIINEDNEPNTKNLSDWKSYLNENLDSSFVLDGIQRLSTLDRAKEDEWFDDTTALYASVLICKSMNKLLYRMITLNNGQKPMSTRHQIEILAENTLDFDSLPVSISTEKNRKRVSSKEEVTMKKSDLVQAYIAFASNSTNIDNQKIIEEKMDELIASQIIDSNLESRTTEFTDVIDFVARISQDSTSVRKWFNTPNNLIAFCASMAHNMDKVSNETVASFEEAINTLDDAFDNIDISKIRLGAARRRAVKYYFDSFDKLKHEDEFIVLDRISEVI